MRVNSGAQEPAVKGGGGGMSQSCHRPALRQDRTVHFHPQGGHGASSPDSLGMKDLPLQWQCFAVWKHVAVRRSTGSHSCPGGPGDSALFPSLQLSVQACGCVL